MKSVSMSGIRTTMGHVFTSVPTPMGPTGQRCARITSGSGPLISVTASGRTSGVVLSVFCGRSGVPGRLCTATTKLVGSCVRGIIRAVVGRHFTRVVRGTSPPFITTRTSSKSFVVTGAGNTFAITTLMGRNRVSGTLSTLIARARQIGQCNFATSRCSHTHVGILGRCRSLFGSHSGRGGHSCAGRCIHRFASNNCVPNVRARCRLVDRVTPRVPVRRIGRCTRDLVNSGGVMVNLANPSGTSVGCPARTRLLRSFVGTRRLPIGPCRRAISGRPLVPRLPTPKGVERVGASPLFNTAILALSGNVGIMLGRASFGGSRVLVATADPNNDALFKTGSVSGLGMFGSIVALNKTNGFSTASLGGMLTKGGISYSPSVNLGARGMGNCTTPTSLGALFRLICLCFATPHVSRRTCASFRGHVVTRLGGLRLGPVITFDSALAGTVCSGGPHTTHVATSSFGRVDCPHVVRVCGRQFTSTSSFIFAFIKGVSASDVHPFMRRCLTALPIGKHTRGTGPTRMPTVHGNRCAGVFGHTLRAPGTSIIGF